MTSEQNMQDNVVKKSNLGFVAGVLLVALLVMWVLKSDLFGKKTEVDAPEDVSNYEIIEEPEITLLDDALMEAFNPDQVEGEVVEIEDAIEEEVVTHEVVDTALGDNLYALLAIALMGGVGMLQLSKKLI